jgi:hypothetical protein
MRFGDRPADGGAEPHAVALGGSECFEPRQSGRIEFSGTTGRESRDRIVLVAHRRKLLTALTGPPATGNSLWFVAHFEGGEKCSGF